MHPCPSYNRFPTMPPVRCASELSCHSSNNESDRSVGGDAASLASPAVQFFPCVLHAGASLRSSCSPPLPARSPCHVLGPGVWIRVMKASGTCSASQQPSRTHISRGPEPALPLPSDARSTLRAPLPFSCSWHQMRETRFEDRPVVKGGAGAVQQ